MMLIDNQRQAIIQTGVDTETLARDLECPEPWEQIAQEYRTARATGQAPRPVLPKRFPRWDALTHAAPLHVGRVASLRWPRLAEQLRQTWRS